MDHLPGNGQIPYGHSWENRSGDSRIWTCGRWEQRNSHIPQDSGQGVAFVGIVSSDFTGKEEFAPRRMLGLNVQGIFISMDCSCGRRSLEKVPRFLHILMENGSIDIPAELWDSLEHKWVLEQPSRDPAPRFPGFVILTPWSSSKDSSREGLGCWLHPITFPAKHFSWRDFIPSSLSRIPHLLPSCQEGCECGKAG